jgi:hypothetical protein
MLRSSLTPKRPAQPPRRVSLSGGGRKNAPSKALAEFSNLMKEKVLDTAVDLILAARKKSTNGRIQRDTMTGILNGLPSGYTRDMIYSREKKRRRTEVESLDTTTNNDVPPEVVRAPAIRSKGGCPTLGATNEADVPGLVPALHNKGGRPTTLGATNEAKRDRDRVEREHKAKADAVQALLALWAVRESGKRSKKNELKLIIEAAKKKFNVQDLHILESMIRDRASRGKLSNPKGRGGVSPMLEIEPLLVTFVICLQRIGQPLNSTTFLKLANSLIKGTALEEKVLGSKKGGNSGAANGIRYYQGFMKRNKDEIDSKCPRNTPADRTKWTTYPNTIESMYAMVYAVLVEAGVACEADSPQWTDKSGHPVAIIEAAAFGSLIVEFILDHTRKYRSDRGLLD